VKYTGSTASAHELGDLGHVRAASSIAFSSSGENITLVLGEFVALDDLLARHPTSSLMQMYCCFNREPQALCSMLKETDLPLRWPNELHRDGNQPERNRQTRYRSCSH
jgi:hypothetical protein